MADAFLQAVKIRSVAIENFRGIQSVRLVLP